MPFSRRTFLAMTPMPALAAAAHAAQAGGRDAALGPAFPSHDPALAREMVSVAHGNVARVRELLAQRPALANATWDWGYGDWESALGAASHVGNREIAGLLIDAGAAPSLFSSAMLGHLDAVKAAIAANPGVQTLRGPHGISLLAHARAGGAAAAAVLAYLETLGDADSRYPNLPLSEQDRLAIAGVYAFGAGPTERFTVTIGDRGPAIQREGGVPRNLFHHGERVFNPVGAAAARIRFAPGERSPSLMVEDGPTVVTAKRVS
jgi:hypothetical protein